MYLVPFVALLGGPLGGKLGTTVAVAMLLLAVQWIAGREHPWRALLSLLVVPASGVFLLRVMGMRPIAWAAAAVLVVSRGGGGGGWGGGWGVTSTSRRAALRRERGPRGLNLEYVALKEGWLVFVVLAVGVHGAVRAWGTSPEDREELLGRRRRAHAPCLRAQRARRGLLRPDRHRVAVGCARGVLGGGAAHAHEAWAQSRRFEAIDPSACATWLARNSQPGDEVFLHDYGAFPRLFYRNDRNVYTLGLDPGFMRAKDPALFHRGGGRWGRRASCTWRTALSRAFYDYLLAHRAQFRPAYRDEFAAVFTVVPR